MPSPDIHLTMQRRQARPWAVMGGLGLAVVAAGIIWLPNLALHLIGWGLFAIAAARVVVLLLEGRARRLGAAALAVVVAAGVVIPWGLAHAERTGSPRWTLSTVGAADNLYADGNRLLFSDRDGLHAVDLTDGSELWSFDDISRIGDVNVAADGHVLIRSDRTDADEVVWLSPDGDPLWRSTADADKRYLVGLNLKGPIASSHGVSVFRRCADQQTAEDDVPCTYVGVGTDGSSRWETESFNGLPLEVEQQEAGSQYNDPARLPELVVVDAAPGDGGRAIVLDAQDGTAIADINVDGSVVITGQTVVYQSGPADGERMCRSHGLSRDGKIDWSAQTPCLYRSGVVLGHRVYGVDADPNSPAGGGKRPINDSFMIDTTTGHWTKVGGLELFNNRSDGSVGVPGADIVVQRDQQHLTGVDPDTGNAVWDLRTPGGSIPGVSSANGAAVVLAQAGRGHNPFYAGDARRSGLTISIIDTATGRVTGRRTMPDIWNTFPTGPGQAVLVDGEQLSLIGSDPRWLGAPRPASTQ